MTGACLICLDEAKDNRTYHQRCLKDLFGVGKPPMVDIDLAQMHTMAAAMAGHSSLSGVQRKISAGLSGDRKTLRAVIGGAHYILKPRSETFPDLPEIELVSMRLAALAQVPIARCGLVALKDGSLAYVSRRFDRPEGGGKLRVEDFCQLAELPPKEKYMGSAEQISRIVEKYCSEPGIEKLKLFRQLLVAWWMGNGDLHRKNLSMVVSGDGFVRLSPAYDMLSTQLLIPNDRVALSIGGRDANLGRKSWLDLAAYAAVPRKAALRVFDDVFRAMKPAHEMVSRSPLRTETKDELSRILSAHAGLLAG